MIEVAGSPTMPERSRFGQPALFAGVLGDRLGGVGVGAPVTHAAVLAVVHPLVSVGPPAPRPSARQSHLAREDGDRHVRAAADVEDEIVGAVAEQPVRGLDGMDRGVGRRRRRSARSS